MAVNDSNTTVLSAFNNILSFINPIIFRIATAVAIMLLAIVAGKVVEKLLLKIFEIIDLNKIVAKLFKARVGISKILSKIAAYFTYLIGLVAALNRLQITTAIITTVVIVLIVVVALFIIFGINDHIANFFAGLILKLRKNISPGDYIKVKEKNIEGEIVSMSAFNVRLETGKDELVFVPNMMLFSSKIVKVRKK